MDYLFTYENSTTGVKNFDISSFFDEEHNVCPPENLLHKFNQFFDILQNNSLTNRGEIKFLDQLEDVLLSSISKPTEKSE